MWLHTRYTVCLSFGTGMLVHCMCLVCAIYVMEGSVTSILGFKERCKHTQLR